MKNLVTHAKVELEATGWFDEDSDYGGMVGKAVEELVRVFSEQGHSGFSAPLALSLFCKVAAFEPLGPLTGEDDEWIEVAKENGEPLYQNRRCGRVFKLRGEAFDVGGRVFRERETGVTYASRDGRVPVKFPYVPRTEYVEVGADPHRTSDYEDGWECGAAGRGLLEPADQLSAEYLRGFEDGETARKNAGLR